MADKSGGRDHDCMDSQKIKKELRRHAGLDPASIILSYFRISACAGMTGRDHQNIIRFCRHAGGNHYIMKKASGLR